MQEPAMPKDEAARVSTLHSLNILDTPRDERYDRYTRISARIFDMPIAVISLVDRYRQWFKSTEGLDAQETPRNISFCGHAILGDDIFEVRNARRDPRFRDNPLVVDQPHVRFYAGAPLEAPNGHKLGTLCILDKVPRRLSSEEKVMLKNLANMVVSEMMNYVDTSTGLANRNALMAAGAKCFAKPVKEREFSLHLFTVDGIAASQSNAGSQELPSEAFGRLLKRFYPNVEATAYLDNNDFCVLVEKESDFDETWTINHLCADAKAAFCADGRNKSFSPFVGCIQFDPQMHLSFDDVMRDVDAMFFRRERAPMPEGSEKHGLWNTLTSWGKTTH